MKENDIPDSVQLIRESFTTVAERFGITAENAPRFTAFATTEERPHRQFADEYRPAFRTADEMGLSGIIETNRTLRFWYEASELIHLGQKNSTSSPPPLREHGKELSVC